MTADHPRPVPDRATGIDLETEAWTLSGQWDRRSNDDPAGCTERMLACASGLAAVDPLLSQWYYDDDPDDITPDGLRERFAERWDDSFPDADGGIGLTIWNGATDDREFSRISLSCWSTDAGVRFGVEFLPPEPGAKRSAAMRDVAEIVVSAWQPREYRILPRDPAS